ncbi:MAG: hypothetical protein VKK42_25035 [Lyngbya sp.]|nr:hypothetical protein [Lyngbya sp.]
MIVLDTNVLSELMHPKGSSVVRQWVAAQPITNLFTTTRNVSDFEGCGIAIINPWNCD